MATHSRHVQQAAGSAAYIPFGRPNFSEVEIAAVTRVLRSGWVGMGPEVIAFESELAAKLGASKVVTVNSCTSALHLALLVNGVGPGDEVIVPSLTWCSTANVALYLGAKPVFCDVDPETLCVTPATVAECLTRRTKAVIAVHFGGLAADVARLRDALPSRVALVEDAAHALGARYRNGRQVGSSGNIVCFSFYANKNLSTAEGGALALDDPAKADRLRSLRQHGLPVDAWMRYTHPRAMPRSEAAELGFKMNYTDLQAALGRVQLRRQAIFANRRLAIARRYDSMLRDTGIRWQRGVLSHAHARHLMVAILPLERMKCTRDAVVFALRRRNVGASIHYSPLHRMPHYGHPLNRPLPATDLLAERILTLPISASMSLHDAGLAAASLLQTLGHNA